MVVRTVCVCTGGVRGGGSSSRREWRCMCMRAVRICAAVAVTVVAVIVVCGNSSLGRLRQGVMDCGARRVAAAGNGVVRMCGSGSGSGGRRLRLGVDVGVAASSRRGGISWRLGCGRGCPGGSVGVAGDLQLHTTSMRCDAACTHRAAC